MSDQRRKEMKRAMQYRSGPDSCSSVYLGGMETAALTRLLGGRYGEDDLQDLIDSASEAQFEEAWQYDGFQWILKHYREGGSKLYRWVAEEIQENSDE